MSSKRRKSEGPTRAGLLAYARWCRGSMISYSQELKYAAEFIHELGDAYEHAGFLALRARASRAESLAYTPWNWS